MVSRWYPAVRQLARYATIGVVSNFAGYVVYLTMTYFRMEPKLAMTLVYITGASIGYLGNRRWTFKYKGRVVANVVKYGLTHLCGYILNFVILYLFVDRLTYPHQAVQAVAIIVVAGFLFVAFKKFVFPESSKNGSTPINVSSDK